MKRWYFWVIALVVAVTAAAMKESSNTQVLADAKKTIKNSCIKQESSSGQTLDGNLDAYCTCTADKIVIRLGSDGVRRLLAATQPTEEQRAIAVRASEECIREILPGSR